jgi:hypothetical protein
MRLPLVLETATGVRRLSSSTDPNVQEQETTMQATSTDRSAGRRRDGSHGSYGHGIYAGHSTHGLDVRSQGSYGRGIYAGHSTYNHDYDTPGSYGRGVYARQNTHDSDFRSRESFARGMSQAGAD